MNIGTVEIPIVSQIDESNSAEIDEIQDGFKSYDVVPVKHTDSVNSLIITGFVNQKTHSQSLSKEEQKQEIKSLRTSDIIDNELEYKDYTGFLLVDSISFDDTPDSKIVHEVEIEARYFPWPKYNKEFIGFLDSGVYGWGEYNIDIYGE